MTRKNRLPDWWRRSAHHDGLRPERRYTAVLAVRMLGGGAALVSCRTGQPAESFPSVLPREACEPPQAKGRAKNGMVKKSLIPRRRAPVKITNTDFRVPG